MQASQSPILSALVWRRCIIAVGVKYYTLFITLAFIYRLLVHLVRVHVHYTVQGRKICHISHSTGTLGTYVQYV